MEQLGTEHAIFSNDAFEETSKHRSATIRYSVIRFWRELNKSVSFVSVRKAIFGNKRYGE